MQKYHDEPKQYKGYLKSALVLGCDEAHEEQANGQDKQWRGAHDQQKLPQITWV